MLAIFRAKANEKNCKNVVLFIHEIANGSNKTDQNFRFSISKMRPRKQLHADKVGAVDGVLKQAG